MPRSDEDVRQRDVDEDPFWEIALNSYAAYGDEVCSCDSDGDNDDCSRDEKEAEALLGGKVTKYSLPNSSVTLELAQLPPEDGVWSPVGDHAWYSSALLTSLIFQGKICIANKEKSGIEDEKCNRIDTKTGALASVATDTGGIDSPIDKSIRVLELGSGAVGLSGISFAVALSQQKERFSSWTVTLTDNDTSLLQQLEANVRSSIRSENIDLSSNTTCDNGPSGNKSIEVEYLDWDLDVESENDEDIDSDAKRRHREHLLSADVVIGSELAYTHETATALAKILLTLLDKNPALEIWIVQVTDRYGWLEIVVPALEAQANIEIESIPLTFDTHEMASTMIPMGGALDRFAFGAFRIRNAGSEYA
mmetsp:Transcript_16515/g.45511  ORF Transcript_16515/g.45511 Transcript_16515/m.45511 type:complete len:364 (+) Transcript_16515:227-1318(+)